MIGILSWPSCAITFSWLAAIRRQVSNWSEVIHDLDIARQSVEKSDITDLLRNLTTVSSIIAYSLFRREEISSRETQNSERNFANGLRSNSPTTARNTGAVSYFVPANAVNSIHDIRPGCLLVWMDGGHVKRNPGHVAVIQSFAPMSTAGGSMCVVEATGAAGATPKLLDSMYAVERIIDQSGSTPMILVVKRHGVSGNRVAVMRA